MMGFIGIGALVALAFLVSEARTRVNLRHAGQTLALQIVIGAAALFTPFGVAALGGLSNGVNVLVAYAGIGSAFIFGPLADPGEGFIVAFQILPIIIFIASLLGVLFHLGVMKYVIRFLGGGIQFLTGASRVEATCAAANVFVGMAEAPLTILPYLRKVTRAQLFVIMSLGLASVSGSVLAAYAALGVRTDLLLTAAFMAPAGGLLFGRILVPETESPFDLADAERSSDIHVQKSANIIEAAAGGALTGLQIMLSVIAVLIAFVAGIALLNGILGGIGGLVGAPYLSLEWIMGYVFAPFAFLIGVPWDEASQAGVYLGQKVVLNEFLAYANFAPNIASFSMQGQIAITVALCGFANLGGLAVLIAGMGTLVPERRSEISRLGLKAVLAGTLSNFTSAAIISVLFAMSALV